MSKDIDDIFGLDRQECNTLNNSLSRVNNTTTKHKRPDNVNKELWNLNPNNAMVAVVDGCPYKTERAKFGVCNKVRKWNRLNALISPKSDMVIRRWIRSDSAEKAESDLSLIDIGISKESWLSKISDADLKAYLSTQHKMDRSNWNVQTLRYLLSQCMDFDFNFTVIADRWDAINNHSIIDLKDQFYKIKAFYFQKYHNGSGLSGYDADLERKRVNQLDRLMKRSKQEVDEEYALLAAAKLIESRREAQQSKTVDLIESIRSGKYPHTSEMIDELILSQRNEFWNAHRNKDLNQKGVILASSMMADLNALGQRRKTVMDEALRLVGLDELPITLHSYQLYESMMDLCDSIIDLYNMRAKCTEVDEQLCTLLRCVSESSNDASKSKNSPPQIEQADLLLSDPLPKSLISDKGFLPNSKSQQSTRQPVG